MRNFMSLIRVDENYSAQYKLMEDTLIKIAEGKDQGCLSEKVYSLDPMKKVLMDNFMQAREQMLLMSKGNIDVNGKPTISDRNTGRPIPIGEGVIPQIERYCSKHVASKITINTFHTVIGEMIQKADNPTGNHFIFVVNEQFWAVAQRVLMKYLQDFHTDGALFYSKTNGGSYYKVGATFDSYEFAGNTISFKVDRTLTREYKMPFAMCIDFTGTANGIAPISLFSLKGKDMIFNTLKGVGMEDGEVATMVAGGAMTVQGWAGVAVFNPYKSFLLYSTETVY